jgi:hypothetical protein
MTIDDIVNEHTAYPTLEALVNADEAPQLDISIEELKTVADYYDAYQLKMGSTRRANRFNSDVVGYNLRTGDKLMLNSRMYKVLDSYPNHVRIQRVADKRVFVKSYQQLAEQDATIIRMI